MEYLSKKMKITILSIVLSFRKIKISKVNNAFKTQGNINTLTPQEAFENAMKYASEKFKLVTGLDSFA